MKAFYSKVNTRTREAMVSFLRGHGRYWTMNSWNRSTSYANCVKVHRLDLTPEQLEKAWEMLDMPQVYDAIHVVLEEWAIEHEWRWQIASTADPVATWSCTKAAWIGRTRAPPNATNAGS